MGRSEPGFGEPGHHLRSASAAFHIFPTILAVFVQRSCFHSFNRLLTLLAASITWFTDLFEDRISSGFKYIPYGPLYSRHIAYLTWRIGLVSTLFECLPTKDLVGTSTAKRSFYFNWASKSEFRHTPVFVMRFNELSAIWSWIWADLLFGFCSHVFLRLGEVHKYNVLVSTFLSEVFASLLRMFCTGLSCNYFQTTFCHVKASIISTLKR